MNRRGKYRTTQGLKESLDRQPNKVKRGVQTIVGDLYYVAESISHPDLRSDIENSEILTGDSIKFSRFADVFCIIVNRVNYNYTSRGEWFEDCLILQEISV